MIQFPPTAGGATSAPIATLETIDARLRWLASWTIHHANHLRDSHDVT